MKRFIMTERNGIYIIDLNQSLTYLDRSYEFVRETVAHGGSVLFIGTKKQAQGAIQEQATRVGMPYVNQRWLGGMLTNFQTVHKRLQRLKELEELDLEDVASSGGRTKKELLMMRREKEKLTRTLGGIRDMARVPSAVWIVDTNKEALAVGEARKLKIPVIAILDTNCDPDLVDYPIPGNDDAIRAVGLLTRIVADAVAEGLMERHGAAAETEVDDAEPLPQWERELLVAAEVNAAEAVVEAEVAESVAEEALIEAAVAEEVAEVLVADPSVPAEVAAEAVVEAIEADAVAVEAVVEAVVAEEIAEEAVAEAEVVEAAVEADLEAQEGK
jgi:small subunit ribosomal protein S2